jgi:hypothetical protein
MSTQQLQLVCDSSTLANFKAWAKPISDWFRTCGWTNSSDSGQVNWGTIASPPGSAAYVFDIFQPGDGLTNFYMKVEYGNLSGTNCPTVRITIGLSTNGSGTITGTFIGPTPCPITSFTAPSTSTQFECDFSGDTGRMGIMMWRNGGNNCGQLFAVERSLNSSGAATSTYVTLWTAGTSLSNRACSQQSLMLGGAGAGPGGAPTLNGSNGWSVRMSNCVVSSVQVTTGFNGGIPFDNCAPNVGFYDYPSTEVGAIGPIDASEGVSFTVTVYGSIRTYIPTKLVGAGFGPFNSGAPFGFICMRYD